jgi:ribosome-associated translation inhibitor RaiA
MQIQINTGHHIDGREALTSWIQEVVETALERLSDHIMRVEVHLRDENGDKTSQSDKHCTMEARLEGHQPLAVTNQGATVEKAVKDAAGKLARLIENTLGRQHDQDERRTDPPPPGAAPESDS